MTMTYTSLIGPKGTTGSIANWVGYNKLDIPTILDEAQLLLYSMLRVREMRTEWTFQVNALQSEVPLPDRFLDPDGPIVAFGLGLRINHRPEQIVQEARYFDNTLQGAFDSDPLATTSGSSIVTVTLDNHQLTQGSSITPSNLDPVGGITLISAASYTVTAILDGNTFQLDAGTQASATATGGGDDGTYTANRLLSSYPGIFAVWDEAIKFECAFEAAQACRLLYFRRPQLLSTSYPTNFLTSRYPRLLRTACQCAAADFMKDTEEYNKSLAALTGQVQSTSAENDMMYRGADISTETP